MSSSVSSKAPSDLSSELAHVALVRHGDYHQDRSAPSAWQPWPLNPDGERQSIEGATILEQFLASQNLSLHPTLYSSTLLRARQTAAQYQSYFSTHETQLLCTDALTERSVGAAANLSITDIEAALARDPDVEPPRPGWKSDPHYRLPLPGAESLIEAGQRVATCLTDIADTHGDTNSVSLVVGHGAALRHACAVLGLFSISEAGAISMYYGMPIVLRRHHGQWSQVFGDWKPRSKERRVD